MSITAMRTKLHKNALSAIMIIGGLAILLPVFFSGMSGGGGRAPEDVQRQQYVDEQRQVVARVGSEEITRGEVNGVLDRYAAMQGNQQVSPLQRHEAAPSILESLRDQKILVASAKKQGLKVSSDDLRKEVDNRVKTESERMGVASIEDRAERKRYESSIRADIEAQRDQIRNELLLQKVVDEQKKKISLDSKDLKPEDVEVNARHILITWKGLSNADKKVTRTKAEAKALADKLTSQAKSNPAGFPALADQNTEDPSGKGKGGDLGWFTRATMVKPFSDAAFKAKSGDVTGPVESQFGYHVIKVEDRRVSDARANQEVQKFLENERKTAKLEILAPDFKAAQAYNEMVQAPPKDPKDTKAVDTKRQGVIAAYEAASKARPKDPALYARLGQLYRESKQRDKALAAYQQAAALPNPSAEIHMALGDLYRESKVKEDKQKALDHYQTAGRLAGNNMMIQMMLQMAYHDMGEKKLAAQQAEKLKNAQQSQGGMPGGMPMTIPGG